MAESLSVVAPQDPRLILATGSYLGEGFDDARLDTLFLTMPISWRGTLQQYVGRLHRLHENKKEVLVYDYADLLVPMHWDMFEGNRGFPDHLVAAIGRLGLNVPTLVPCVMRPFRLG